MTDNRIEINPEEMANVSGGGGGSSTLLPERAGFMVYRIARGDTLSKIARRNSTTVNDIMAANIGRIFDRNDITAGYYIYIPI